MRGKYVIAGIGHTAFGRLPGRGTVSMNVEACRNALADAGIDKSAVDALFVKVPTSKYPVDVRPDARRGDAACSRRSAASGTRAAPPTSA